MAYVEERYGTDNGDGEPTKATGKPLILNATLDQVLAKARELGIHAVKHTARLDDGESTGRSAFAPGEFAREKMSGFS